LIANIKSLKAGKKIYVKPIVNKITNLMQLLSNKMKTNTQYKDYLQNKYLLSKKTFYLLSQAKAANQAIFSKVNHGTLRYTNNTLFLKASRNSLILNYIRPILKHSLKSKKHVVPSLLKQKYFQKLQAFSSDKLEIFKTLNAKNKIIFKINSNVNLYKNNRFKILKPNTKLDLIKTYNLKSIPKQLFKVSKIRSNRAISLKLKEIFGKMKNRDLLLKNYVLKEIQRLVLTYVNLFQTAHKHYVDKKVNALQLQKFAAAKLKTKKKIVNKN
jgi:hypothetical protein